MGHGNASDFVALSLIGAAITSIFKPSIFFTDLGPIKGLPSSMNSPEIEMIIQFNGGLLLAIAMIFSGVKWNPVNGKMAGLGCFLCVFNMVRVGLTTLDDKAIVLYLLAAVITFGGAHIFFLPSNESPPKTEKTKNNHGNFSDIAALKLIAIAVVHVWFNGLFFKDHGPVMAMFKASASTPALGAMLSVGGGLLLIIAMMFSGVKWNPVNGKMAGMGCFLAAFNAASIAYKADSGAFVLRPLYLTAAVLLLGGLSIFLFPSNPLPPKKQADPKKSQ